MRLFGLGLIDPTPAPISIGVSLAAGARLPDRFRAPSFLRAALSRTIAADCAKVMQAHGIVIGADWGTLVDPEGRARWQRLGCDAKLAHLTPALPVSGRSASAGGAGGVSPAGERRWPSPRRPSHDAASERPAVAPRAGGGRAVSVFWNGLGRYRVFRIPALLRAKATLLAFAEARPSIEDHGRIDLELNPPVGHAVVV